MNVPAATVLCLLAFVSVAQPPRVRWEWLGGPLYAPVTGLVVQRENLFLLAPRVAWISPDGGRNWHNAAPRLAAAAAIAASDGNVYIATANRIEQSTDGGRTWNACGMLPAGLAADPSRVTLAADGVRVYVSLPQGGLYRSEDRCGSWEKLPRGWLPESNAVLAFARGSRIVTRAGPQSFLSADAGSSWISIEAAVPEALAFDAYCVDGLVAGTGRGLRIAVDGRSWAAGGLAGRWVPAVASPRCGIIYAAARHENRWTYDVMRSLDGGKSWTAAGAGLPTHPVYALSATASGTVYASGMAGMFRTDLQDAWQQIGPRDMPVFGIATAPWGSILAATEHGLLSRNVPAGAWRTLLLGDDAQASAHVPVVSARAIAVTRAGSLLSGGRHGLLRSTDRGETWRQAGPASPVNAFVTLPGGAAILAATRAGIFRSRDDGGNWMAWSQGLPDLDVLSLAVSKDGAVYAGTQSGEVLHVRREGAGWSRLPPLPGAVPALLVSRTGAVLAGTAFGLFRWRPGDTTWLPLPAGGSAEIRSVRALAQLPDGAILAATDGLGVFVSRNDGTSWTPENDGLSVARVLSLTVAPNGRFYAGTTEGAFRGAM